MISTLLKASITRWQFPKKILKHFFFLPTIDLNLFEVQGGRVDIDSVLE